MSRPFNDGSVRISQDELFDSMARTQGGLPHLIQFLWDAYVKERLEVAIEEKRATGKPTVDLETAKKKAPAVDFAAWATQYLTENRIMESFYIDGNVGLRLTTMQCVAVCPGINEEVAPGSMQESNAIGITQGRSRPDNNGVINESDRAFRI